MSKILVTGANQGIGFYMVEQLLRDGNAVAVLDRETDRLEGFKNAYQDNFVCYKCDVSIEDEVNTVVLAALQVFGEIDIAVHNACKCTFYSVEDTPTEVYKSVFGVNYYGALHIVKALAPSMKVKKKGKFIFSSSGVGVMGFINISPYASSKGALESLARCLNIEYRGAGITAHLFHPPLTRTHSSAPLPVPKEFMADPEKVGKGLAKRIHKKKFILCHSFSQTLQTRLVYLFPQAFGRLLSKMTAQSAPPS